jgi:hypothetical protein
MSMVRHESGKLPPDPTRKARLAAVFARPESEIDFSDIPEADAAFWASAVRLGGSQKPRKRQTTIRLDEVVQNGGKGLPVEDECHFTGGDAS